MIAKRIDPRELANRDVDEAITYYLSEASDPVALGFPHIVFYVETSNCIDVWRGLHGASDIPAWMWESNE